MVSGSDQILAASLHSLALLKSPSDEQLAAILPAGNPHERHVAHTRGSDVQFVDPAGGITRNPDDRGCADPDREVIFVLRAQRLACGRTLYKKKPVHPRLRC